MMKLSLLLLALPAAFYAQDSLAVASGVTPYSSGAAVTKPFDNKARAFKDWSVSVGGGGAFMQSADLTSFYGNKINWGWNGYISLDKQISHTFGISAAYQMGETKQRAHLNDKAGVANAWTKYHQVALLGDINFSSLMRRVDNKSAYKWALHGYGGVGIQGYNTSLIDDDTSRWSTVPKRRAPIQIKQKLGLDSFFYEFGAGLMYNVNSILDLELRGMYVISGDDSFDGGGWTPIQAPGYNQIHASHSDNYFTVNLGLSFKLGKHPTHLRWFDPTQDILARTALLENTNADLTVCKKGDNDNDGVCDDWDRQLDTPAGARVDGAGVALDMDKDGIIDLYDKCVTVPGPASNNGCPVAVAATPSAVESVSKDFEGIEFELNKAVIRPSSFEKLNHAAQVITSSDQNAKYLVIGATDTRASDAYNMSLSQKRADAVMNYLISKGVNAGMLTAEGRGAHDLKYPECNPATKCPEWKNEANRRVYFQAK